VDEAGILFNDLMAATDHDLAATHAHALHLEKAAGIRIGEGPGSSRGAIVQIQANDLARYRLENSQGPFGQETHL